MEGAFSILPAKAAAVSVPSPIVASSSSCPSTIPARSRVSAGQQARSVAFLATPFFGTKGWRRFSESAPKAAADFGIFAKKEYSDLDPDGIEQDSVGSLTITDFAATRQQVSDDVCKQIADLAAKAIAEKGVFNVAFAAGTHFPLVAKGLVSDEWKDKMQFEKWRIFFASERFVPKTDPDNNFTRKQDLLFKLVKIPMSQIFPVDVTLTPELAARKYEQTLKEQLPLVDGFPQLDLALLGIGDDGHTAGLFPMHPVLNETRHVTAAIKDCPMGPKIRITMTLPMLNNAKTVIFVTTGLKKKDLVANIIMGDDPFETIPAKAVLPKSGDLFWFVDRDAASIIDRDTVNYSGVVRANERPRRRARPTSAQLAAEVDRIKKMNTMDPDNLEVRSAKSLSVTHIADTTTDLADYLSEFVCKCATEAIEKRGVFNIAMLSGSHFPVLVAGLTSEKWKAKMNFSKWHVWFASERCVTPDNIDSNYWVANNFLLKFVGIPQGQVHPIDVSVPPQQAAEKYETLLRSSKFLLEDGVPRLDLALLGIGDDGHTAGLFSLHPILNERKKLVAALEDAPSGPKKRVTMTLPMLNNSRHVAFITSGLKKRDLVQNIVEGDDPFDSLPAKLVVPKDGDLDWFMDKSAAALVTPAFSF